jgi:hypothetical protein
LTESITKGGVPGADVPLPLQGIERPFTFAVVGDAHIARPPLQTALPIPQSAGASAYETAVENVEYAVRPMLRSLRNEGCAFTVFTGDLCEPLPGTDPSDEDLVEALRVVHSGGLPALFARGESDPERPFEDRALAAVEEAFGRRPGRSYYHTDVAGCRLVILDTTAWDSAQAEFLRMALSTGGAVDRLFVFGHHPLFPVARAFATNPLFAAEAPALLSNAAVDAYFCGHTHDQTMVVHRIRRRKVIQCGGSPVGIPGEVPTPLERVQAFLPDPGSLHYRWSGYLENTAPGWFVVRVADDGVAVSWHHLGRGVEATAAWRRAGEIRSFWAMPHPVDARLTEKDLPHIRRAYLRFCALDASGPGKRVQINGVDVGVLPFGRRFVPGRMELPDPAISHLEILNRVEINAPGGEASTVANLMIEAVLPGGRIARSKLTGEIFTWSDKWGGHRLPELVKVLPGHPIRTVLSFR